MIREWSIPNIYIKCSQAKPIIEMYELSRWSGKQKSKYEKENHWKWSCVGHDNSVYFLMDYRGFYYT